MDYGTTAYWLCFLLSISGYIFSHQIVKLQGRVDKLEEEKLSHSEKVEE